MKARPDFWIKLLIRPFAWRIAAHWFRHAQSAFLLLGPIEFAFGWNLEPEDDDYRHCDMIAKRSVVPAKTEATEDTRA